MIPPLPWKFDFNDITLNPDPNNPNAPPSGEAPMTWIGARYRHKIIEKDGDKVMVKITTIPKGTRSQSWMGPDDMHDYTIQADLRGQHHQQGGNMAMTSTPCVARQRRICSQHFCNQPYERIRKRVGTCPTWD